VELCKVDIYKYILNILRQNSLILETFKRISKVILKAVTKYLPK
jgi:hypothetical protein